MYRLLLTDTSATSANCASIEKTFAMLSIRIYEADASIIVSSAAISASSCSAKINNTADSTAYTPSDTSIPVRTRFENAFLSSFTFPIKKNSGSMIASLITSYRRFTHESCPAIENDQSPGSCPRKNTRTVVYIVGHRPRKSRARKSLRLMF